MPCSSVCSCGAFWAASDTAPHPHPHPPLWQLAGCLWAEAVAPLRTKARIRAGGEAYREPLLCLDWKRKACLQRPPFHGLWELPPVGIAQTKSSCGIAGFCQTAIDPVPMASNERPNAPGNDISVVFVCSPNERFGVFTGFGFSCILMTAENNRNVFLLLRPLLRQARMTQ